MITLVKENYTDTFSNYTLTVSIPKITERKKYFAKQKLIGVVSILLAVATLILTDIGLISIVFFLLGFYLSITKNEVVYK